MRREQPRDLMAALKASLGIPDPDPDPCPDCGGSGEVGWLTHPPDPQTAESRPCDCQRPGGPVTCDDDPLPF